MINFLCLKMIKICNILSYQENQSHFWFNDGLISIEKEKKIFFFNYLSGHLYFLAPVWPNVPRNWNLKYLKTGLFLSPLSVIFGFLTQKYPYQIQDERMTRTIITRENVNSTWWILPHNTHFGQIFKSQ